MAAQQLIPVFTGELTEESTQLCNARDLHTALQISTRFDDWMRRRIEEYGFVEGEDFSSNLRKSRGGRPRIDYRLTIDMAKELAMIENNEVGRQVRRYFIRAEKELRQRVIAELQDRARHVLELPGVKSLRSGITFKQTLILQRQSRELMALIVKEPAAPARQNMHWQLRQVNDALGIPTEPIADIVNGLVALEG